jgi:transcriptional regulator with XRE-family HTH domain
MLSIQQIRAARALLGWTQKQLAQAAGLSVRALNMIELEQVIPRAETLRQLYEAFSAQQIKFEADHGVKLLKDRLEISRLGGVANKEELMEDIITQLRWSGGLCSYVGPYEEEFVRINRSLLNIFYKKCWEYRIKEAIISAKGYTRFVARPAFYRWLEPELIGEMAFCVYSDTTALFTGSKGEQIVILRNKGIASYFLRQHKALWQRARELPFLSHMREFDGGIWTMERAEAAWQKAKKFGY